MVSKRDGRNRLAFGHTSVCIRSYRIDRYLILMHLVAMEPWAHMLPWPHVQAGGTAPDIRYAVVLVPQVCGFAIPAAVHLAMDMALPCCAEFEGPGPGWLVRARI